MLLSQTTSLYCFKFSSFMSPQLLVASTRKSCLSATSAKNLSASVANSMWSASTFREKNNSTFGIGGGWTAACAKALFPQQKLGETEHNATKILPH